ncbi:LacI family DNA-binding transcriptional regulator [Candidatus Caldatribacterium sp.]|uniref:LacI family DNA-binding transcriptional regulator n=1 Tax=Candidatus Caldatribacterium sp. TaxID=2282143 RepID=UPI00299917DC|nr:LacI family transcriptional regulator [Candidatus Caldatribacterium sp.]MDW8081319.1 LacI family DNA-binding transcriptional regulator [Candidatus Calescibacterium sp.]
MTTIYDVAKKAGVSPATVSRALSGAKGVSEVTRRKVLAAARELHYSPNYIARSLKKRQTNTIALIISDITNPFFTTLARGVEDKASEHGFNTIFCNTDEDPKVEAAYVELMLRRQVDGLLISSCSDGRSLEILARKNVPVVLVDRKIPHFRWDYVVGDSEYGAYVLTRHLVEVHGKKRIAIISGPLTLSTSRERVEGYQRALREVGVVPSSDFILIGTYKEEFGYQAMKELLTKRLSIEAVFAGNNVIAVGAIRAARELGVRIPEDLVLVTFDDFDLASALFPFLTTAKQPAYTIGTLAVEMLLERIRGEKIRERREVVLRPEIIIRRSCGCP